MCRLEMISRTRNTRKMSGRRFFLRIMIGVGFAAFIICQSAVGYDSIEEMACKRWMDSWGKDSFGRKSAWCREKFIQ